MYIGWFLLVFISPKADQGKETFFGLYALIFFILCYRDIELWDENESRRHGLTGNIRLWRSPAVEAFIEYLNLSIPYAEDYITDPNYPVDS